MKKYYLYDTKNIKDIFYLEHDDGDTFHGIMVGYLFPRDQDGFLGSDFYYPKQDCRLLETWEVIKYKLEGKILNENDSEEKNRPKS